MQIKQNNATCTRLPEPGFFNSNELNSLSLRGYGWSDKPAKTSLYRINLIAQDTKEMVST